MSNNLIDERPILVFPALAEKVGSADHAAVLQQIYWLCAHPQYVPREIEIHTDDAERVWVKLETQLVTRLYFTWFTKSKWLKTTKDLQKDGLLFIRTTQQLMETDSGLPSRWYYVDKQIVNALDRPVDRVRERNKKRRVSSRSRGKPTVIETITVTGLPTVIETITDSVIETITVGDRNDHSLGVAEILVHNLSTPTDEQRGGWKSFLYLSKSKLPPQLFEQFYGTLEMLGFSDEITLVIDCSAEHIRDFLAREKSAEINQDLEAVGLAKRAAFAFTGESGTRTRAHAGARDLSSLKTSSGSFLDPLKRAASNENLPPAPFPKSVATLDELTTFAQACRAVGIEDDEWIKRQAVDHPDIVKQGAWYVHARDAQLKDEATDGSTDANIGLLKWRITHPQFKPVKDAS